MHHFVQRFFIVIVTFIVWGSSVLFMGCTNQQTLSPHAAAGKNVLLISLDTTRIDYVQPYGSGKLKTPALQALASDGIVFVDAVSPTPLTVPAHASLFTGMHPVRHKVQDNFKSILSHDALTLAELFSENGYQTAGVIGAILLSERGGFAQGFAFYDDEFSLSEFQDIQPVVERKAGMVTAKTQDWLEKRALSGTDQPFFLFVHYYDPHMLYQPPEPYADQYKDKPYAGEIAYTDAQIGVLIDAMKQQDLYDETLIVVVGDHGEGLKNHNEQTHGLFLYEEVIRVPFIIKPPASLALPQDYYVRQSASLLDVVPTLVDLCGLGFSDNDGISLAPWLVRGASLQERFTVHETQYPLTYNWSPVAAIRSQEWKYVLAPKPELYNLQSDPKELRNLINDNAEKTAELHTRLEEKLKQYVLESPLHSMEQVSSAQAEVLSALGYASGGGSGSAADDLPDPKDKIEVYELIDNGLGAMARNNINLAQQLFQDAAHLDPKNPNPYFNLAMAYRRLGKWTLAIETMNHAISLSSDHIFMYLQLAKIYISSGDHQKAEDILTGLAEERPSLADVHFQLGWIDLQRKDYNAALAHLEQAQKWMPDMPGLQLAIEEAYRGR